MREPYGCGLKTSISEADPGQGPGGPGPLIFGQTEARRAEKPFFQTAPLPLSQGLDDPPPPPYLKVWIRHWISRLSHKSGQILLNT